MNEEPNGVAADAAALPPSGLSPEDGSQAKPAAANAECVADGLIGELYEALELADCLLSGANMNKRVVERKVRAALAKARGERP